MSNGRANISSGHWTVLLELTDYSKRTLRNTNKLLCDEVTDARYTCKYTCTELISLQTRGDQIFPDRTIN